MKNMINIKWQQMINIRKNILNIKKNILNLNKACKNINLLYHA